ncbi:hypothetical protein [Synechocystis sp. LKSZ1]|uniref:hypothetical protein n=1 Tax=Synechocystis sp. LKSZ1 TaxID=3144951 RepID=UPI00336C115A
MTQSLASIREKLIQLEAQTQELSENFVQTYQQYIQQLDQVLQQQLILAIHQVCTHLYPDEFLQLNFSDRQQFQSQVHQLSGQFQTKLTSLLHHQGVQFPPALVPPTDTSALTPAKRFSHPEELVQWCRRLEQGLQLVLEELSHTANQHLQAAQILPNHLPPQVLEMALQAQENGMNINRSKIPHVLSLLVETNQRAEANQEEGAAEEDNDGGQVSKLIAIHLRLTDIEFADSSLGLLRKQLRQLVERLKKLHKYHHQLQRESRIAEAERAWQSSWSIAAAQD